MKSAVAAALVSLVSAMTLSPALAEFPREGVAEVPNGKPEPFVGSWQVGFPETPDMIVTDVITPCETPVVIAAEGEAHISYASPKAEMPTTFELREFSNRTSWIPEGAPSSIAVWDSPDSFYLYSVGPMGSANWDDPRYLKRCP